MNGLNSACVLLVLAVAEMAPAEAQELESQPAMVSLLTDAAQGPAFDTEALVARLLLLGPRSYAALSRVLDTPGVADAMGLRRSTRVTLERDRDGIARYVSEHLARASLGPRRVELESRLALQFLRERGTAGDLALLFEFMTPAADEQGPSLLVTRAARDALSAVLQRDPVAFERLPSLYARLGTDQKPSALQAVGSTARQASIDFLSAQLRDDEEHRLIVLAQLGRVAQVLGVPLDDRTTLRIMAELQALNPALQREACLVLGRLEETAAVPALIELLGEEHEGLASSAHWALERIGGVRIPPDAVRWRRWWERESTWWIEESDALLDDLYEDPGTVAAALRQLGPHRLYRHTIAGEILHVLDHEQDSLVAQACAVLGVLRSRVACARLELVAGSGNPQTSPSASQALRAIRG